MSDSLVILSQNSAEYIFLIILLGLLLMVMLEGIGRIWWIIGLVGALFYYLRKRVPKNKIRK